MAAFKSVLFFEFVVLSLAVGLWFSVAPVSLSRDLSPVELIQNGLPGKKTMKSASKSDFLSAVCAAARKNRKSGPGITAAAIAARSESAGDIVATVLRCAGKIDCEYVGAVVAAAISVRVGAATAISDAAIARAPNCEETIQTAVGSGGERDGDRDDAKSDEPSALIGTRAGADEGFDPHEQLALVCENGTQRAVRESQLDDFLRSHPGSFSGRCPPVPSPSPSPSSSSSSSPSPVPQATPAAEK